MCKVRHCLYDDALATQAMSKIVECAFAIVVLLVSLSFSSFFSFFKALPDPAGAILIVSFSVYKRNATTRRAPPLCFGDYVDMLGFPFDRIVSSPAGCGGHQTGKLLKFE